jgi:hypothetical protein
MKIFLFGMLILTAILGIAVAESDGSKTISADNNIIKISSNISQLDTSKPVATFEGGKLYMAGNLKVVDLHGSYREMGRQYGALMKNDLNEMYDNISADFGKKPGANYDGFLKVGRAYYNSYPQRYREVLNGIGETSGLGLDKELIINSIELNYLKSRGACSGIAAWGNYTSGEPLVFGRNFDWINLNNHFSVAVYNPDDGNIPVACVGYTGCVYVCTGMNKNGVFLELNNGMFVEAIDFGNRVLAMASLFSFLEDSQNLDQLDIQFHTARPTQTTIINVANQTGAYSYEWATFDVKRRGPDRDGLLVGTNQFVDPSWGINLAGDTFIAGQNFDMAKTNERRQNLLALGEKYKGNITPETMMEIISLPIEEGGASFIPSHHTSYQVVAVPENLTMWVRIPYYQDWVEVDLKPLFS